VVEAGELAFWPEGVRARFSYLDDRRRDLYDES